MHLPDAFIRASPMKRSNSENLKPHLHLDMHFFVDVNVFLFNFVGRPVVFDLATSYKALSGKRSVVVLMGQSMWDIFFNTDDQF